MLKFWRRNKQEPTKPEQEEVRQDTPDIEAEEERQEAEPVFEPEPEPEPDRRPGGTGA